jgi:hypothetical protein
LVLVRPALPLSQLVMVRMEPVRSPLLLVHPVEMQLVFLLLRVALSSSEPSPAMKAVRWASRPVREAQVVR